MKRLLLLLLVPALLVGFAQTNDTAHSAGTGTPEYMALGDSLAAGFGASDPATTGYVPLTHQHLKDLLGEQQLTLLNLGHSGDTSTTLISHGHLATAVAELQARNGDNNPNNDVEAVTIDIGGNDVLALLGTCAGGVTPACTAAITSTFATFSANFSFTLSELHAAAGPDTPISVMTYYNSLIATGCPNNALAPLGDIILEGEPLLGLPLGLNDLIRLIAAGHGSLVAETFGQLGPNDITPDCVHANDDGYEIIADEFKDTFKDG